MKQLNFLILFLIISILGISQNKGGVIFEQGTLNEALAKATKGGKGPKVVFLDCYTTWCGPCKNMTDKVFPQEKVGAFFNANFVNIKIDMEKGEGPALAKKYGVKAYPTFLILDASGKEIGRVVGGGDADTFITKVKKAMDPQNNPQARLAVYEADKKFSSALAYLEALQSSYLVDAQNEFLNKNFAAFQWYEKYSHPMWPFLNTSLSKEKSGIFDAVIEELPFAYDAFGKDKVNALLTQHIKRYIVAYLEEKIPGATVADLQKRLLVLNFVNNADALAAKLGEIAKCVVKNDYTPIANLFQAHVVAALPYNDRPVVERAVLAIKDKLGPKVLYHYYNVMASSNKSKAAEYEKQAESYKPNTSN